MDKRIRVLVVDDDTEIRELLGRYLEGQGFEITSAANRLECEARIETSAPDIVVLDGSGLDICRWIKDRARRWR